MQTRFEPLLNILLASDSQYVEGCPKSSQVAVATASDCVRLKSETRFEMLSRNSSEIDEILWLLCAKLTNIFIFAFTRNNVYIRIRIVNCWHCFNAKALQIKT